MSGHTWYDISYYNIIVRPYLDTSDHKWYDISFYNLKVINDFDFVFP